MSRTDKKLAKLGFVKGAESEHGATYTRTKVRRRGFHKIDILNHSSGDYLIVSYDCPVRGGFNTPNGLSIEETKLALKKAKELKRKYGRKQIK